MGAAAMWRSSVEERLLFAGARLRVIRLAQALERGLLGDRAITSKT